LKYYVQLMIILLFSLVGEFASNSLHLPVPGSIIGLFCLFLALQFNWIRLRHINAVGQFLLANMTILFLPAAVGIMDKFNVIAPYLIPICLILLFAVIFNIAVIALVVQFIKRHYEGDFPE